MGERQPYGSIAFSGGSVRAYLPLAGLYAITAAGLWRYGGALPGAALALPLIWLSVQDLKRLELPDIGSFIIALIGAVHAAGLGRDAVLLHLLAGFVVMAVLWGVGGFYFRRQGREGLGIGDAKLFGAGAVVLGPWQLPDLFLLSSAGGIAGYALSRMNGRGDRKGIPFGPYIAYAIFVLSFLDPLFL